MGKGLSVVPMAVQMASETCAKAERFRWPNNSWVRAEIGFVALCRGLTTKRPSFMSHRDSLDHRRPEAKIYKVNHVALMNYYNG